MDTKFSTTSRTTTTHGLPIVSVTTTPFETMKFNSTNDWRVRAISASNLPLRSNLVYVTSHGVDDSACTFVLPKNLLKKFIAIADLRTQIGGLLYGVSAADHPGVKEIRCIVLPPQHGSQQSVTFPLALPAHTLLKDMQCLGWLHTQPHELAEQQMSTLDIITHTKFLAENKSLNINHDNTVVLACCFTPGSCSLTAYQLTTAGMQWAAKQDLKEGHSAASLFVDKHTSTNPSKTHEHKLYRKVPLILSSRLLGFYLVPEVGSWNYNFHAMRADALLRSKQKIHYKADTPKEFFDMVHRPVHFIRPWLSEAADDGVDEEGEHVVDAQNLHA